LADQSDYVYRRRLQTLLSVDDLVGDIVAKLNASGLLDNTYIIYTADNGFHLGQFRQPFDKRTLYEADIRVPMVIRGPGVTKNLVRTFASPYSTRVMRYVYV
jgi:N-acetylglucosamine-6-sulfatase